MYLVNAETILWFFARFVCVQVPIQEDLSVFVTTWNVGNKPIPHDLSKWLPVGKHDLYVIGVQECKFSTKENNFEGSKEQFRCELVRHFGRSFTLVRYINFWEIRMAIFCRNNLVGRISGLTSHKEATGIANLIGTLLSSVLRSWRSKLQMAFGVLISNSLSLSLTHLLSLLNLLQVTKAAWWCH